jgi:ribosomal protein S18 acetylase RimI-like enzyme
MLIGLWSDDSLVGYIIGATRPGEDSGDIFWLYVEPEHRGRGLGADLLMESVGWLQQKGLKSVELVTYDHAEFYKKHNFNLERVAKGFIGGQDVYIMKRSLL